MLSRGIKWAQVEMKKTKISALRSKLENQIPLALVAMKKSLKSMNLHHLAILLTKSNWKNNLMLLQISLSNLSFRNTSLSCLTMLKDKSVLPSIKFEALGLQRVS